MTRIPPMCVICKDFSGKMSKIGQKYCLRPFGTNIASAKFLGSVIRESTLINAKF